MKPQKSVKKVVKKVEPAPKVQAFSMKKMIKKGPKGMTMS